MEIILGKTAGFCGGVKRAVEGAISQNSENKKIYCLGEIVHNKQVVQQLEKKGIKFIDNLNEAENNSKVIIRAHGVEKKIYEIAKQREIELIDYTCTSIIKIQNIIEEFSHKDYYIFLLGSRKHPEIIGLKSFAGEYITIIEGKEEIEEGWNSFQKSNLNKLLMISQTTFNIMKFKEIENIIKNLINEKIEFIIKNTICPATQIRQDETEKISKKVNKMIIIGGKNSSNTNKLYEIAKKNCNKTFCIETEEELYRINFTNNETIGIMAGASTPKDVIENVINYLKKL